MPVLSCDGLAIAAATMAARAVWSRVPRWAVNPDEAAEDAAAMGRAVAAARAPVPGFPGTPISAQAPPPDLYWAAMARPPLPDTDEDVVSAGVAGRAADGPASAQPSRAGPAGDGRAAKSGPAAAADADSSCSSPSVYLSQPMSQSPSPSFTSSSSSPSWSASSSSSFVPPPPHGRRRQRPRGRPRKHTQSAVGAAASGTEPVSASPAPRGRGRPRRHAEVATTSVRRASGAASTAEQLSPAPPHQRPRLSRKQMAAAAAASENIQEEPSSSAPRRRSGRPRKEAATPARVAPAAEAAGGVEVGLSTPRRRPGRPRKVPVMGTAAAGSASGAAANAFGTQSASPAAVVKKERGSKRRRL